MAHAASHFPTSFPTLVARVVAALIRGISAFYSALAQAQLRAVAVERLYAMSDAALADKGLTREGEIDRILSDRFCG